MCARIGGDEFLLVITHAELEGVQVAVERIRKQIEAEKFTFGSGTVGVTASFGIASFVVAKSRISDASGRTGRRGCCSSAKRLGRNRVKSFRWRSTKTENLLFIIFLDNLSETGAASSDDQARHCP